jgi:hypothetical protein
MKDKIYDIYWDLIGWRIRYIYRKFKNLYRWFPIIWNDQDYDDHYIFDILKFKLKNQAKYISDNDRHTRAALDAKRMRICVDLIDKISDEYYSGEYMDYHETKWEFIDVPDRPGYSTLNMNIVSERFNEYFKKYPLVYKKVLIDKNNLQIFKIDLADDESEIDKRIAMNIGHYNHKRARKLLFKIMEENIEGWWD